MTLCPCGSGKNYTACCGLYIDGQQLPPTPEALMRSRYTAYTQANIDYIARTAKSPAADNFDAAGAKAWAQKVEWLKLQVIEASTQDNKGFVEFLAFFNENKKRHAIHEISEFHLDDGQWYYVDGKQPQQRPPVPERLLGRNEPCMCGSGKKYKKCCGMV